MPHEQSHAETIAGPAEYRAERRASAASHVKAGRYDDAVRTYRELLDEDPDDIDILVAIGELCLLVGDQPTAVIFFRRILTLDRSNMPASRALARIASQAGSGVVPGDGPPLKVRVIRPLPLWDTDERFVEIMSQITYSLVDRTRCYMLYQFARDCADLPGEVAEIGVYRGGTARLLAKTLEGSGKPVHLFDTFEGMPSTDPSKDAHRAGDFSDTSLASVQKNLEGCASVLFYPGYFPATSGPIEQSRFCLAHIDVDIYRSVLDCCNFFYPRMVPGGKMVFDDYGYETCPGAKLAVDEFFRDTPERPFYIPSGQCLITKRWPTE